MSVPPPRIEPTGSAPIIMLASVIHKFHLLKYGLALVLVFVGIKMSFLNHFFGGKFPIGFSLAIIVLIIGGAIIGSITFKKDNHAA